MNSRSDLTSNRFASSAGADIGIKDRTLEAAIRVFLRFGSRKTTMSDIAEEAGIARQTVHAIFGSKAKLIDELVRFMSRRDAEAITSRLPACKTLEEKLDVYLNIAILDIYDLFQQAKDPAELVFGNRAIGENAIREVNAARVELVEDMLADHIDGLARGDLTARELAVHLTSMADKLKLSTADRPEVVEQTEILKKVVLAVSRRH